MRTVIARQRLAVPAEVGDVVEAGLEPRILRLDDVAAARIFAFAEIQCERQLLFVGNVLIGEQQHGVFIHAGFDIPGLQRRQGFTQIDARNFTEEMRVKLPDRDRHGVSPGRGMRLPRSVWEKKLLRDRVMSTVGGAWQWYSLNYH